jgi:putative transposase
MPKPYSNDLRDRVIAAVLEDGVSCRRAAARFGVAASTAIAWVRRFRETGVVAPGQMGGHRPRTIRGMHEAWLSARLGEGDFTLRGLVAELAGRGLAADYWAVWRFVHEHGLTHKKRHWSPASRTAPMLPADASSG